MSRLELQLRPSLTQYVASAIAVGNDEDASEEEYQIAERIEKKLGECPHGARITIEPLAEAKLVCNCGYAFPEDWDGKTACPKCRTEP